MNHGSRVKFVPAIFLHVSYVMVVDRRKLNLCNSIRFQQLDNIAKIKKMKSTVFRFESLLTHFFFYVTKNFFGVINWDSGECTMKMIT